MQGCTFTCRTGTGLLMAAIFCVVLLSPQYARPAPEAEQLIVLIQPDVSPVAKSFRQRRLPLIRKLAQRLKRRSACGGCPQRITCNGWDYTSDGLSEPSRKIHLPGAHHNPGAHPQFYSHLPLCPPGKRAQPARKHTGMGKAAAGYGHR